MIKPNLPSDNLSWQDLNPRPAKEFPRNFVDKDLDLSNWNQIQGFSEKLLNREIKDLQELKDCMEDYSELNDVINEEEARLYIEMTGDTADEKKSLSFENFVENIEPNLESFRDSFHKKIINHPDKENLPSQRFHRWIEFVTANLELFDEKNLDLNVEITKRIQDYQKLTGSYLIEWEGKKQTLPKVQKNLEENNREIREKSWRAIADTRLESKSQITEIFEDMFRLRNQVASNLNLKDYREYCFKKYHRTDYDPNFCFQFHETVEKVVVPLYTKILEKRKEFLGLDKLRPWDTSCGYHGTEPLKPFKNTEELVDTTGKIFSQLDSELYEFYSSMKSKKLLDLENREGKAPGGYQCSLDEVRFPFIFMNSVGSNSDVFTLLHECGHSFHYFYTRDLPDGFNREAPMEFCEVASMSMERLCMKYLNNFYSQKECDEAIASESEEVFRLLVWVTIVDKFQHWLYTHPQHTNDQRENYWAELMVRFSCGVDWSGLEKYYPTYWFKQLHIFEHPFYYIEYGIAQLGALQFWNQSLENEDRALSNYKKAMRLGGTKGLKDLFEEAELNFNFSPEVVGPLVEKVYEDWKAKSSK